MRDLKLYIGIALILLCFYVVALYNQPRPVNWKPTLSKNDKIPLGTYVVYNQLKDIFPRSKVRALRDAPFTILTEEQIGAGNYILVSQRVNVDGFDFKELRKFMAKGNNVLIAGFLFGTYLSDSLKLKVNTERKTNADSTVQLSFVNPALSSAKKYAFARDIGYQYFSQFDTSKASVLGVNNRGHANFIRYRFGKGSLFLVASPMFFTNYSMLEPNGAEYASKLLSYLPDKRTIIWEEFSALGPADDGESPLRVIFNHDQLRWAYFITLITILLFVVYESKRRQRIIPMIEPLKNTSVEFINIVGQLYYQQRDNANLARKRIAYLLEDIRSKYLLKTEVLDENFIALLAAKSGLNVKQINDLVTQMVSIQSKAKVSDQELIALNKLIENFHYQSR